MNETKICPICGQEKHYTNFSRQRDKSRELRKTYCTTCESRKRRQYTEKLDYPLAICQNEYPHLFKFVKAFRSRIS